MKPLAAGLLAAAAASILAWALWQVPRIREPALAGYERLTDRQAMVAMLETLGAAAPAGFIVAQIAQVILAPVPGELSGVIGGYLFGTLAGFCYSSIGLTIGSWINFHIGRVMGKRYIRKRIPPQKLEKMDSLLKRQGLLLVFFLFLFPGFPKDYLCLFLGLSQLPGRVFLAMAAVGRMPGTLLLSLQGAALFQRLYTLFAAVTAGSLLLALLVYRYRERLYRWADRAGGG